MPGRFRAWGSEFKDFGSSHVSYSLNSLKGDYIGEYCRHVKGDTRCLDYTSCGKVQKRVAEPSTRCSLLLFSFFFKPAP